MRWALADCATDDSPAISAVLVPSRKKRLTFVSARRTATALHWQCAQVSWQALEFLRQRHADGKLKLWDFRAEMVPLQLAALQRPADGDPQAGQRRMQLLQLLQMQVWSHGAVKLRLRGVLQLLHVAQL